MNETEERADDFDVQAYAVGGLAETQEIPAWTNQEIYERDPEGIYGRDAQ